MRNNFLHVILSLSLAIVLLYWSWKLLQIIILLLQNNQYLSTSVFFSLLLYLLFCCAVALIFKKVIYKGTYSSSFALALGLLFLSFYVARGMDLYTRNTNLFLAYFSRTWHLIVLFSGVVIPSSVLTWRKATKQVPN
jgi:hypothetical protein